MMGRMLVTYLTLTQLPDLTLLVYACWPCQFTSDDDEEATTYGGSSDDKGRNQEIDYDHEESLELVDETHDKTNDGEHDPNDSAPATKLDDGS